MLLWLSWTASSAQTLQLSSDTVHCYDRNDMKAIALRVIEATECDTMIAIYKQEIVYKDSIIDLTIKISENYRSKLRLTEGMLEESDQLAKNYEEELKLESRRHKGTKRKWFISTVAIVAGMILLTK